MKCREKAQAELLEYCERLLVMRRRQFEELVLRRYRPQPQPETHGLLSRAG